MNDLIAKMEAATEGSRELDVAIFVAVGHRVANQDKLPDHMLRISRESSAPHYTTSIDAALTLAPEKMLNPARGVNLYFNKTAAVAEMDAAHITGLIVGRAATPALALCIAALKARET